MSLEDDNTTLTNSLALNLLTHICGDMNGGEGEGEGEGGGFIDLNIRGVEVKVDVDVDGEDVEGDEYSYDSDIVPTQVLDYHDIESVQVNKKSKVIKPPRRYRCNTEYFHEWMELSQIIKFNRLIDYIRRFKKTHQLSDSNTKILKELLFSKLKSNKLSSDKVVVYDVELGQISEIKGFEYDLESDPVQFTIKNTIVPHIMNVSKGAFKNIQLHPCDPKLLKMLSKKHAKNSIF